MEVNHSPGYAQFREIQIYMYHEKQLLMGEASRNEAIHFAQKQACHEHNRKKQSNFGSSIKDETEAKHLHDFAG